MDTFKDQDAQGRNTKRGRLALFGLPMVLLLLTSLLYLAGCGGSTMNSNDSMSDTSNSETSGSDTSGINGDSTNGSDTNGSSTSGTSDSSSDPKALYESTCNACHSLSVVENADYSGDQWDSVVKRMQAKTSTISDSDAQQIAEYLKTK